MSVKLHIGDLPKTVDFGDCVAIDTEAMGLNPSRDRLCLVQLSAGDGTAHIVQFKGDNYDAPNLRKLLSDPKVTKLFHYARFDVALMWVYLNVLTQPIYCTKIASRLARTFAQHHGLKALSSELLGIDVSKKEQLSDWGAETLTKEQMAYAASDVLHLHKIREKLDAMLEREGRTPLVQACFDFLPHRAVLDIAGWADDDIFAHH